MRIARWLLFILIVFEGFSFFTFAQNVNLYYKPIQDSSQENKGPRTADNFAVPLGVAAGTGEVDNASALFGFTSWKRDEYYYSLLFNYGGDISISGEQKNYGSFLLKPASQGPPGFTGSGNINTGLKIFNQQIFLSGRGGGVISNFENKIDDTTLTQEADLIFINVGIQYVSNTFEPFSIKDNDCQIGVELSYGLRWIFGEILEAEKKIMLNKSVLGTSDNFYNGLEFSLFVRINNLLPYIRLTHYEGKISGFSDWKLHLGIDVLASVLHGKL